MNGRLIAIGDIHGCHLEFAELLARLSLKEGDRVILLGDLINRGPDSNKVLDLAQAVNATSLLGNHELRLLEYKRSGDKKRLKNGDFETFQKLRPRDWAFLESMRLTLEDLQRLPQVSNRVNHYCVEGWTAVETWTGVPFSALARLVGATPEAQYVDFQSFDNDYHESWDLESAMHAQSVVAYGLDGKMLGPAHGAPARFYSPVKLGYKNTKYLTKIVFLPKANGGYWTDQGYEWYAGV